MRTAADFTRGLDSANKLAGPCPTKLTSWKKSMNLKLIPKFLTLKCILRTQSQYLLRTISSPLEILPACHCDNLSCRMRRALALGAMSDEKASDQIEEALSELRICY